MPVVCLLNAHNPKGRRGRPFFVPRLLLDKAPHCANRYTRHPVDRAPWLVAWVILPILVFLGRFMKSWNVVVALLVGLVGSGAAWSQERIYRCGNEYTNNPEQARLKNCRPLEGGNLTVVQGTRPATAVAPADAKPSGDSRSRSVGALADAPRAPGADPSSQRNRHSDARAILEAELRRAEDALAQARQAFAGGQPEKQGPEFRNHQMYLDRVAQLQAAVQRAEADVASIKRELSRLAPPGR